MKKYTVDVGKVLTDESVEGLYAELGSVEKEIVLDCRETRSAKGSGVVALVNLWRELQELGLSITVKNAATDLLAIFRVLKVDSLFKIERRSKPQEPVSVED
jgi:anti-anti-sigma regulatory factor